MTNRKPERAGSLLVLLVAGLLLWEESRRPLRRQTQSKPARDVRNLGTALISAIVVGLIEVPTVRPLANLVERRTWGIRRLRLPQWAETVLAVLLMDYTLYLWHVAIHSCKFLWRFHQVHHVDLDMDVTTAFRFHFGEILLSVPYRWAQILLIGVGRRSLALWQRLLLLSVIFHHSNLHLPPRLESRLAWLVMTPRLHTIHHSVVEAETNSNWSSGLTLWDRMHGTFRLDVPAENVTIGVPAFQDPKKLTLIRLLKLPFGRQRPSWQLPPETASSRQIPP
ncbi:MAG TPA: sterol desaturase family protein [Micropepsaceae bacterium]|nr:sterol desaturase family protein [Micropepsaceae bacterium]